MSVQITLAEGSDLVRRTFSAGTRVRYDYDGVSPYFALVLVLDQYGRILASFDKLKVLQVDVNSD